MSLFSHPFYIALTELANVVEKEWAKTNNNFESFSSLAYHYLNSKNYSENFSLEYLEILKNNLESQLPALHYSKNKFSDFPITLIRRDGFFIDLYVWENSYTDIHNHHFAGAFQVLHGGGVNFSYEFKNEKKIEEFLFSGELNLLEKKNKNPGVTFEIRPGDGFIHQSLHALGSLSVTLCLRTENNPNIKVFEYFFDGFKLSHFYLNKEDIQKMDEIFQLFTNKKDKECIEFIQSLKLHFQLFCLKDYAYLMKKYNNEFIDFLRKQIVSSNSVKISELQQFDRSAKNTYLIFQKILKAI